MAPTTEEDDSSPARNLYTGLVAGEISLQDNPSYVALSYTWGSPVKPTSAHDDDLSSRRVCTIDCNGARIQVTENLHAFLRMAQRLHLDESYWIDAICINQEDVHERTSQVEIMSTIYRSADRVFSWLGEGDQYTERSFDLIESLAAKCSESGVKKRVEGLMHLSHKAVGTPELERALGRFSQASYWTALVQLFQRRYFTRAWIIQEVTLGRNNFALCGDRSIAWQKISLVSEFLAVSAWSRWMFLEQKRANCYADFGLNHTVPNLIRANLASKDDVGNDAMLYSLIRFRRFKAKDPRDKVYALLGISGAAAQGKRRLTPVYEDAWPVERTYMDTAVQILEDSDNLLLLSQAEGEQFQNCPTLPSWVPDWSCASVVGLGITGYKRFQAAGSIPRTLYIDEGTRSLTVKGLRLDDIVLAGEEKGEVLHGYVCPKWLEIYEALPAIYHTGQSRREVFWRVLVTDTAGAPPKYPAPESYAQAYGAWIKSRTMTMSPATSSHSLLYMESEVLTKISDLDPAITGASRAFTRVMLDQEDYETTFSHALHLRLFLTSRRFLGVGSKSLGVNDSVWIIHGSRVPLILREARPGTFRIVGGAYVHGFMQGEALGNDPIFKHIAII